MTSTFAVKDMSKKATVAEKAIAWVLRHERELATYKDAKTKLRLEACMRYQPGADRREFYSTGSNLITDLVMEQELDAWARKSRYWHQMVESLDRCDCCVYEEKKEGTVKNWYIYE